MRIVFLTVLFLVYVMTLKGQNSFSFDKEQYHFDTLYEGDTPNAVFLLKNIGNDTLYMKVFSEVESISITFSEAPVYPGKCSMIQGQLNTLGIKDLFKGRLEVIVSPSKDWANGKKAFLLLDAFILKGRRPDTKFVSQGKYNLGEIMEGEEGYFKLDFKNTGTEGLFIKELNFKGIPFFYSCGYYRFCSERESKPLVGSNEIIRPGEAGCILLKLSRTDLEPKEYETLINIQGNFKMQVIKLKFKITE